MTRGRKARKGERHEKASFPAGDRWLLRIVTGPLPLDCAGAAALLRGLHAHRFLQYPVRRDRGHEPGDHDLWRMGNLRRLKLVDRRTSGQATACPSVICLALIYVFFFRFEAVPLNKSEDLLHRAPHFLGIFR
jgi:hypothetical protein